MMIMIFLTALFSFGSSVWAEEADLLANLPPDPGAAGKATLEGIDSDNDDVQRWIVMTYPNSEKTRAALTQRTQAMQLFLLDAVDSVKTRNHSIQMGRGMQCFSYIRPNDSYQALLEHKAIFLNTYFRSKTWLQADRLLSGGFFSLLPDPKQGCSFNPDVLRN